MGETETAARERSVPLQPVVILDDVWATRERDERRHRHRIDGLATLESRASRVPKAVREAWAMLAEGNRGGGQGDSANRA